MTKRMTGLSWPEPYHIVAGPVGSARRWQSREMVGIPRHERGTVVLWFQGPATTEGKRDAFVYRQHLRYMKSLGHKDKADLRTVGKMVVVIPETWSEQTRTEFSAQLRASLPNAEVVLRSAAAN